MVPEYFGVCMEAVQCVLCVWFSARRGCMQHLQGHNTLNGMMVGGMLKHTGAGCRLGLALVASNLPSRSGCALLTVNSGQACQGCRCVIWMLHPTQLWEVHCPAVVGKGSQVDECAAAAQRSYHVLPPPPAPGLPSAGCCRSRPLGGQATSLVLRPAATAPDFVACV
jgi:hypothetical protein